MTRVAQWRGRIPRIALSLVLSCGFVCGRGDWSRAESAVPLGSRDVEVLGLSLEINPSSIGGAPRNVPLLLSTQLIDGAGTPVADWAVGALQVRGVLRGPGLAESVEVAT